MSDKESNPLMLFLENGGKDNAPYEQGTGQEEDGAKAAADFMAQDNKMTARSPTHWPDNFSPDDFSPHRSPRLRGGSLDCLVDHSRAPRPLAEIVQWLLQQQLPQLLAATESLRDRWRNDAATRECLRELTKLDLSACEISRFEYRGSDQYGFGDQYKLSILLHAAADFAGSSEFPTSRGAVR
jgi:hypothetical protein